MRWPRLGQVARPGMMRAVDGGLTDAENIQGTNC